MEEEVSGEAKLWALLTTLKLDEFSVRLKENGIKVSRARVGLG